MASEGESVTTLTEKLPSLSPPDDENVAHIALYLGDERISGPLCGAPARGEHRWHGYFDGKSCSCGAPVCRTCRDMAAARDRSGITP